MSTLRLNVHGPLGHRSYGTAEDLGLDPDGGRWVVICEDHFTLVNVDTLARARSTATEEFCDVCQAADSDSPIEREWAERGARYEVVGAGIAANLVVGRIRHEVTDRREAV